MRKSEQAGADVAVVGGGVAGLSAARELARRGMSVVIIESAEPGAEASGAAAGMLAPQSEADVRDVGGKATGVVTPQGFVSAGAVVLAAGARTSHVPLLVSEREDSRTATERTAHPLVEPVRGQMLCLRQPLSFAPFVRHVVY